MTLGELRAAIKGPADAAGLRIEEGLTDRLLHDLGDPSDGDAVLPMLSYTLQETWRAGNGRVLTLSDYQATGGIWNAVTQAAERTYSQLRQTARDGAKLLLVSMIRLGDGTDDVRCRIQLPDLLEGRQAAERAAILEARDAFVGARLISVAEETSEITHEALLCAWPRLRQWISEDRKDLLDRQRLADAARTWDTEGRQRDALYAGARLEMVRPWLGKDGGHRGPLSPLEREFLETSARAARRRRGRRWLSGSVAVVAAVVLVAALVNARQQQVGNRASQVVESSVQLAQEADDLRASDPAGALWLSLTAYHSATTPQARSSLYRSLTAPYPVTLPGSGGGAAISAAYSPDGRTVAAAWSDGTVRLWRVTDPLHPARIAEFRASRHGGAEIAFSPDGRLLATHTAQALKLWNVRDPARPVLVSAVPMVVPVGLHGRLPVAFSPDGRVVATGNPDGRFRLLDVSHPGHPVLDAAPAADGNGVNGVAFSPDGKTLATASAIGSAKGPDGGRVRLWDVRAPRKPSLLATRAVTSAIALAFSPAGHLLVAVGASEDAHTWDITDPTHPKKFTTGTVDDGTESGEAMGSIAFRPDGKAFITADTARRTDVWSVDSDRADPSLDGGLPNPAGTYSVAYSPSGRQLITGDLHGSVQLWTALVPPLPGTLSTFDSGTRFGHDGHLLVTDSLDINGPASKITGGATLWNVSDPLRPVRTASLPRAWPFAEFLPGGRVLLAWNNSTGRLRLWDTTDPRRPLPGAIFPVTPSTWDANSKRLLAVLNNESSAVQVWNVRDVRRPVLDATIPAGQSPQSVWLLGGDLLGVVGSRDMRLWDLADPRHPAREGVVPDVGLLAERTFVPSTRLLTGEGLSGPTPATDATVWSLADPRRPVKLADIDADPETIGWVDEHTIAASTADDNAVGLWRVRASGGATQIAAQPFPHGPYPLIASGDGGLLAEAILPPDVQSSTIEVWRVSGDHGHLSALAQLPGGEFSYEFSPDGGELVTYPNVTASEELQAFPQYDSGLVIFPLNADTLYRHLCSVVMSAPVNQAWKQYLPTTSYRPACS
jgi:WD40 repeat protein